jgi:hypothetical protein
MCSVKDLLRLVKKGRRHGVGTRRERTKLFTRVTDTFESLVQSALHVPVCIDCKCIAAYKEETAPRDLNQQSNLYL